MKTPLLLLLFSGIVHVLSAQDDELYRQLTSETEETITALDAAIDSSEEINAVTLFTASGVALNVERYEDSAFLFYVAKFRAQHDLEVFEPLGSGGDSPMALFGALSFQLGSTINPEIMRRPTEFTNAVKRASAWRPTIPSDYNPGWDFKDRRETQLAAQTITDQILDFEKGMIGLAELLSTEEYFEAFCIVQDYNMTVGDEGPTKEEFERAVSTMTTIEKSRKIRGMFFDPGKR